ncbi:MAG: hypothetical protein C0404_14185 [Verrucomicrobia bacterium]|nr:hypothetical protein [Verrucomicrobiota bacterium]
METMESPDSILEQVLGGNVEKYEEIIRAHQQDIYRVVAIAHFDWATARDIVQRTFVQAYLHLDSYKAGTNFGAWIKTIARNLVREELRKRACKQRHLQSYRDEVAVLFEEENQPDASVDRRLEALRHCRGKLPESYSQIVDLHYARSQGIDELAGATGKTSDAVKQMLWRARLMLRQCINKVMAQT